MLFKVTGKVPYMDYATNTKYRYVEKKYDKTVTNRQVYAGVKQR